MNDEEQDRQLGSLVKAYQAKRTEIVCLRRAIGEFRRGLADLAKVLNGDLTAIGIAPDFLYHPVSIGILQIPPPERQQFAASDFDMGKLRVWLGDLHAALEDRAKMESELRESGHGDLIQNDPATRSR